MSRRKQSINLTQFPLKMTTKSSELSSPGWQELVNWWPSPDDIGAIEVVPGTTHFGPTDGPFAVAEPSNPTTATVHSIVSNVTPGATDPHSFIMVGIDDEIGYMKVNDVTEHVPGSGWADGWSGDRLTSTAYGDYFYIFNGNDSPLRSDFNESFTTATVGYTQPSTTSFSTAATTATTNVERTVKYFYSVMTGTSEGPLSPAFGEIDAEGGSEVTITCTTTAAKRFYRTTADGTTPQFLGAVDSGVSSFVDNIPDSKLGGLAPTKGESPPSGANFPIIHYNRMWVASGNKVYWSDLADPMSWFSENHLNIAEDDNDYITGLASYSGGMYIFKRRNIYKVIGRNPEAEIFQISPVIPPNKTIGGVGTPSYWSIAATPVGIIFYSNKSFYLLTEEGLNYISRDIEDYLRDNVNTTELSTVADTADSLATGAYDPTYNLYICSLPTGSDETNGITFCYSLDTYSWFIVNEGYHSLETVVRSEDDARGGVVIGSWVSSKGNCYRLFDPVAQKWGEAGHGSPTDSATITATAALPPLYFESPSTKNRFLWTDVSFDPKASGEFKLLWKFDGQTTANSATVSQIKSGFDFWEDRVNFGQTARSLQVTFKTSADQPRTKLYSMRLEGQKLGNF